VLIDGSLTLTSPAPTPVTDVTVTVFGAQGSGTNFYWLVTYFPIGNVTSGPFMVRGVPPLDPFTGANFVRITWQPQPGATRYDVLKTPGPQLPNTLANIGMRLFIPPNENQVDDVGAPPIPYDLSGLTHGAPVIRGMYLNNRDYQVPTLQFDAAVGVISIIFADGTMQSTAAATYGDSPFDGSAYGRDDAHWVRVVQVAGDRMTGPLYLPAPPVLPSEAANKEYVDSKLSLDEAPFDNDAYGRYHFGWLPVVQLGGDRMTGRLVLSESPTAGSLPLQAATKEYVDNNTGTAPNSIPNLILWLAASDRTTVPVKLDTTGIVPQGWPVDLNGFNMPDRTGTAYAVGDATSISGSIAGSLGSELIFPTWGSPALATWLPSSTLQNAQFNANLGMNRFDGGFTLVMLWYPFQNDVPPGNIMAAQMGYRTVHPDLPLIGPGIITANSGAGTGFAGMAYDGIGKTTEVFRIAWNTGWYMLACRGENGGNLVARCNGTNTAGVGLGTIQSPGAPLMGWGKPGMGLMLEGMCYDRALTDSELLSIENYWKRKYDNIQLGDFVMSESIGDVPVPATEPSAPAVKRKGAVRRKIRRRISRMAAIALEWARSAFWFL
jgi:hypothetical protein